MRAGRDLSSDGVSTTLKHVRVRWELLESVTELLSLNTIAGENKD
jgi:hypothetical protein